MKACRCLWHPKGGRRDVKKLYNKQSPEKYGNLTKNGVKRNVPERDFFYVFWGMGPKAPQGGPKDPPGHPPRSNVVRNCIKNNIQNGISMMFK